MANDDAVRLGDDPRGLFGCAAEMFALDDAELAALQLEALQHRFDTLRPRVKLLDRLAGNNGIDGVATLDDGASLLYPSNVYKSYAFDWLIDGEYDRLTRWLQQLTAHDLSTVDVASVASLDDWFTQLEVASPLRLCHSSSTSGKLSFVPRGVDEWVRRAATLPFANEAAGHEQGPRQVSFEGLPVILPFYRSGHSAAIMHFDWFIRVHTDPGNEHPERVLTLHEGALSSDLMVLAGRLRSGQLSGDPRSMQLPERLLDRREELSALLEGTGASAMQRFVTEACERFSSQRCVVTGVWPTMVDAAAAAHALGQRSVFDPTSFVLSGGGEKGRSLPANAHELVASWTGVSQVQEAYGMSELMGKNTKCAAGNYHLNPWLVPYVLDVESLDPLPRTGRQQGRFAGIDLMASSYWSGYISTDLVTLTWEPGCACGRHGPYLESTIERVHNVEDDKVSCAATPEAHDEAIEFLRAQGA